MKTPPSPEIIGGARRAGRLALLVLPLVVLCACQQPASTPRTDAAGGVVNRIDWPSYMARHDLVWTRVPDAWESGAFTGNGLVGANIFLSSDKKNLRWHIGRSDVVSAGQRIPVGELSSKPWARSRAATCALISGTPR